MRRFTVLASNYNFQSKSQSSKFSVFGRFPLKGLVFYFSVMTSFIHGIPLFLSKLDAFFRESGFSVDDFYVWQNLTPPPHLWPLSCFNITYYVYIFQMHKCRIPLAWSPFYRWFNANFVIRKIATFGTSIWLILIFRKNSIFISSMYYILCIVVNFMQ